MAKGKLVYMIEIEGPEAPSGGGGEPTHPIYNPPGVWPQPPAGGGGQPPVVGGGPVYPPQIWPTPPGGGGPVDPGYGRPVFPPHVGGGPVVPPGGVVMPPIYLPPLPVVPPGGGNVVAPPIYLPPQGGMPPVVVAPPIQLPDEIWPSPPEPGQPTPKYGYVVVWMGNAWQVHQIGDQPPTGTPKG